MSFLRNTFRALSKIEKRILWVALGLIVIGAAGSVFVFIKNNTITVPAYSGSYSEGLVGQPSYINSVLAASDNDQSLVRLIFANIKDLADSIDVSADGSTIQVHLKQGLTWSDNKPLNSDDVIFTLESIQNADSRSPLSGLFGGVRADRVSALQVDFHLENLALAESVLDLRPVPKHLYGDIPPANWRLSNYNLKPVASGPYVFSSHEIGSDGFINAYRLAVNHSYAGTKPYLQKINFLFFHNEKEMLGAFNNGQIQGFATSDPSLLDDVQRSYDLTQFMTPTVYGVFWNQTTNPALEPIEARWALNLALDRGDILAAIEDYGQIAEGPLPPVLMPKPSDSPTVSSSTEPLDPTKILEQKDWRKSDDGIWTKKTAKSEIRLEFALTVPDIDFLKKAAQEIAAQWEAFGAKVNLNILPPDASLMATITNRSYDGLLFGNTVRGAGDLYPFWHSAERFAPGLNLAVYQNPKVDALLETIRKDGDTEKRSNDLRAVSQLITYDEPAAFLFSVNNLYVSSKNLEGVQNGFLENPGDRLELLPQWYVRTTRKLK